VGVGVAEGVGEGVTNCVGDGVLVFTGIFFEVGVGVGVGVASGVGSDGSFRKISSTDPEAVAPSTEASNDAGNGVASKTISCSVFSTAG
jgi:hypothetical protein